MKLTRTVVAGAAALAACGVLAMVPPAALASSSLAPDWTRHAPPTHPTPPVNAAMTYNAAASNVVLFGGEGPHSFHNDTWIWG